MNAGSGDHRKAPAPPTTELMTGRGSQLLEAHIRSLDPGERTAHERLEEALGERFARRLVLALCPERRLPPPRRHFFAA